MNNLYKQRLRKPDHYDNGPTTAHAHNMGFAIAGVLCFVDTVVLDRTVSLRRNCSANHPRHRKPLKR